MTSSEVPSRSSCLEVSSTPGPPSSLFSAVSDPPADASSSELRQVPDTQEVLLSPDSDLSVILEVLERVTDGRAGDDDEAALRCASPSLPRREAHEARQVPL